MSRIKELEKRLDSKQIQAANLLVANEFAGREEKQTHQEIADECGISRMTLFRYKKNPDFVTYMDAQSELTLASYRSLADAQLMRLISGHGQNNGLPSVKGLELYYKLFSKLVDKSEVLHVEESPKHNTDAIRAEIERFKSRKTDEGETTKDD
ncbi:hypothetical protein GLW08_08200 [Pontibacillus yanchengensis]|uniref:Uncharacterized protein n=1 Tax=Pontibacillus yanchengensis TaxID=462910 RepID=A0ACC7VHA9_9BACI|nr:phBC6A51 family helix-turn-helix protein [Pontibacillus yanchengensis]MYL53319.1 hypothetical protein [Pontibacillus yanchengensis]